VDCMPADGMKPIDSPALNLFNIGHIQDIKEGVLINICPSKPSVYQKRGRTTYINCVYT